MADDNMSDEDKKKADRDELFARIKNGTPETVQPGDEDKQVVLPMQHAYNSALDSAANWGDTAKSIADKLPRANDTKSVAQVKRDLNQAYTTEGMIGNFGGAAQGRIANIAGEAVQGAKSTAQLLQETNPGLYQKLVMPEMQAATAGAAPAFNQQAMQAFSKLDSAVNNGVKLSAAEASLWQQVTGKVYRPPAELAYQALKVK